MKIIINGKKANFGAGLQLIQSSCTDFSIEIVTPPTKTLYYVGEIFDPAGMVVHGTFPNGFTVEIPHEYLTFSLPDKLDESIGKIAVTFQSGSLVKTVYQTISVEEKLEFEWWSPEMTSNSSPTPFTCSAYSEEIFSGKTYQAFCAFNIDSSFWSSNGKNDDEFIQFNFGEAASVYGISMAAREDIPTTLPRTFSIYGSNDGINWSEIIHVENLPNVSGTSYRETIFPSIVKYQYYKIANMICDNTVNFAIKSIKFLKGG